MSKWSDIKSVRSDIFLLLPFYDEILMSCGRMLNIQLGEKSRLAWLGVEADPLLQSDNLLKAYNRPSEAVEKPNSKWFISKNAVISGLALLGIKQGSEDTEAKPTKARRKRIVRKKVSPSSA